jgi:uncharacterized membrane protein YgcG
MRVSARILSIIVLALLLEFFFSKQAHAQTIPQPSPSTEQAAVNPINYMLPNADPNVPVNHHSYTQIVFIDTISAIMCELTGVDPSDPKQACLGVDPTTGKIGLAAVPESTTLGSTQSPPIGGAVGFMSQSIASLYVPAVSTSEYVNYLASNFGIVKPTYAAVNPGTNCNNSPVGYGFCGLSPIFTLWANIRDLAYAMLTILFIAIGVGVMLRFRVDPRTVMTLQNQIPRVIIAILLITFSFAIAGAMIDLMWTVTYTGINFISSASPNSQIALCPPGPKPISQVAEQRLIDQPISFTNTLFRADCNGNVDNGILSLSEKVSDSVGDLVQQLLHDLLFSGGGCNWNWTDFINPLALFGTITKCALGSVVLNAFLWLAEQIVKLIVIIVILIALFRLWFELIKTYLTFLIFVILGPIWIVLGLIPGRPMGFEKWLRIVFTNLAIFPLVAFILVFARVIVDAAHGANPQTVFVPPLVGNPNLSTFSDLMGFGAILLAPTIPNIIRERMKAKGQANYGAAIAGAVGAGAAAATAPGRKAWESLNRRNPQTGAPEGSVAMAKHELAQRTPIIGRYTNWTARKRRAYHMEQYGSSPEDINDEMEKMKGNQSKARETRREKSRIAHPVRTAKNATQTAKNARQRVGNLGRRIFGRGGGPTTPPAPDNGTQGPGGNGPQGSGGGGTGTGKGGGPKGGGGMHPGGGGYSGK